MDQHNKSIATIAAKVREYHKQNIPFRIYHGSTNSTRHVSFAQGGVVDTSNLCNVLEVNRDQRTVLAEPNVPMDQLVEATLPHGLVPPVIMEFPGITVGGGFAGTAGESSSFEHGFFDRTVNWIEMVAADGEVLTASSSAEGKHGNADLFHGAAGSLGTLGVITLLEIKLVDATKFVQLTYHPISSTEEAIQKIQEETESEKASTNDYVDGIMFGLNRGVIITGRRTEAINSGVRIQRFSRAQDPWFYLHAKKTLDKSPSTPTTELTPLTDYLFRYDRGAFWTGAYSFPYFLTPFNRITRFVLDNLMHTRTLYHAMHESGLASEFIIQDLRTPRHNAQKFIEYIDENLGIYPLWLCPIRNQEGALMHPHIAGSYSPKKAKEEEEESEAQRSEEDKDKDAMLLNVGVWGPYKFSSSSKSSRREQFISANRALERKLHELGGMKWLYAQTYYTEEEFWQIYDREKYDELRQKYGAVSLPSAYEKAVSGSAGRKSKNGRGIRERWPFAGIRGVLKMLMQSDYLQGRKK